MNREQLKELGLTDEQIESVMKAHGKSIQDLKPAQEELDGLKTEKSTLEQQLADLQNTLNTQKDELSSVDDLKKEVETYKLKDLKTNIAVQAGIPLELAGRLSGSTEEEIKADAEKIAGFVNKKQPLPMKTTEPPKVDEKEQAYAKILENLKGE
ncbi:phage scaffold protein [Oceanobacillus arenosus]|uniref:Phage scaffold protein n=1 Tax=Oceanobacillus arenosus TaxID=1229153 RepID=A0A3D8PYD6_9BACI|nr:phage scaffold protein [Oceanobacillus arenosus]RDW21034.1 phage scaffold protein [Oceanobacillus arenosus]